MNFRRKRNTTMSERELAVLSSAQAEVRKMPAILARGSASEFRIHCYECRRDHRITRSVYGTRCDCGSTSFRTLGALDLPAEPPMGAVA